MNLYTLFIKCLLLFLASFLSATAHAEQVVVTSGRVEYDPFGRAVRVYHPTVDSERVDSFSRVVDTVSPTGTEYDELDRPLLVRLPDGTITTYEYSLVGNALKTTVTDAEGNSSATVVNGSGKTVASIQYKGPAGSAALTTSFVYDGVGRLIRVTDPEGNVTESTYDYGDRRTKVVHPASGETGYTYDRLGNVLTVQTANLKESGASISYQYELGRLTGVHYPEHPENDVSYRYGDENDDHHAKGRVVLRLDGTGGLEYSYDNMGNVSRTLRTVVVPNEESAVGTFETEFTYDSYGKLLDMTYPDGEKVCYWYDSSAQLTEVYIKKKDGVHYVEEIGYDKFGDRTYIRYGDKSETRYSYLPTTRRLSSTQISRPQVGSAPGYTLSRNYTYDDVGNITELSCSSTGGGTGLLQPPVTHQYAYDALYRLTGASGSTYLSTSPSAQYSLAMEYDDLYRITSKNQTLSQTNVQFTGTLSAGYTLSYNYNTAPGKKFQMSDVVDVNYRKAAATVTDSDKTRDRHFYEYDRNGNITHVSTSRRREDRAYRDCTREEKFRWDEENRLLAISQNGYVSNYWYDADGERVVKEHGVNGAVFVNSERSGAMTDTRQFTVYPSAYLSVHDGGRYTNHIYIGSERIASRLGTMDDGLSSYDGNDLAGSGVAVSVDYESKYNAQVQSMKDNYSLFGLTYSGEDRYNDTTVTNLNNLPDIGPRSGVGAGTLRYYCMLGGGEDDGEESESNGHGQIPDSSPRLSGLNTNGGKYYYHSDHLGSSTLITNGDGFITQQIEYLPYGEVFLEKQRNTDDYLSPYRFNGKELDEETGLYYYGARYYNPRLSVWYGTDPLQEFNLNISSYCFVHANPIRRIDAIGLTDYEVDNETKRIEDGHDDLRISVGTMAFDKLQTYFSNDNYSYEKYLNELSVQNGFVTTASYPDAESTIGYGTLVVSHAPYGQSYSEWSIESNSKLSPGFNALNDINSISMAFSRQANNVNVGDNGKWYYRQNSGRIFYSNQYVITTPASIQYSKYISGMNKAGGAIAIVSSGYDIYQGYVQDGNRFGYNAQVQTAGAIGGYALGVVGAKIGAEIGTSIGAAFGGVGAVPGGIIGGIVGGVIFSIWGNHQGQQIAKDIVK